jgi:hypothetical protein
VRSNANPHIQGLQTLSNIRCSGLVCPSFTVHAVYTAWLSAGLPRFARVQQETFARFWFGQFFCMPLFLNAISAHV